LSSGQTYSASNVDKLNRSYEAIKQDIGYRTVTGPATAGWLRPAVIAATIATGLALLINQRLPT
jgi:Ca-activated chloride channel homolog